ncbi:cytochrome c class I [Formosa agariphila KMM 3901]|uniref:Cytochrome c class I n=1 Tax=Formosa agariphila (strain DSM 15362 / KCTC 12365 / LMG 23005 / KMM 3901 / M-2Alg 35-1) TaxID=1347342 RepID=T2KLT7_FORAG|nr:cbb3-type cytochrome c oxidase N-terminal domain-containing protein [Formosa agariphila]CDF79705.1 cytochrome c class I [Formosa agariphila KMM 3901]
MRKFIPAYIRVPVLFFLIAGLVEYFVDSGNEPAFIKYPAVLLFLLLVLVVIISIEGIVSALDNVLFQSLNEDEKARFIVNNEQTPKFIQWIKDTYIKLLGQRPIADESEIVLDHNYDGIRELDNSLPPWWKYAFYISIVFAIVYMLKYEVFDGDSQIDEYNTELAEAKIAIEEYKKTAKDLVDANTVTVLTDASDLSAGKSIFETNCVACHMADGGGGIGPNLTDDHWILGGGIKNVFHTVSEGGRDGKGMIAWKQSLKPVQIAQVSSYILSLQGTTPAKPKAAEGEIWVEETAAE